MLVCETCFVWFPIITVGNERKVVLDSQKRICFCAKETLDPDRCIYRELKTSVVRSIMVFRYMILVAEHLKFKLRKRGKEARGMFK